MNKLIQTQLEINTIQMKLPLDLGIKINISDPVVTFKEVMEGVNLNKYLIKDSTETRGRDGYDPKVLLKIVLFAFMINVRSTRKIESLCRNDIRFMYLSDEITPSHMTICNFINDYLLDSIENISNDIVSYIIKKQNIDISTIFIDGTKIEAFPNKYTWVWKNSCITSRNRQFKHLKELFHDINNACILEPGICFEEKESYSIEELENYSSIILSLIEKKEITFVYGRGHRKDILQRYYDKLNKIISLLKDYAIKIDKCGEHRNSYSKTDVDATFMRMKTDYMGNTSLLPAYNWQLVSSGELILFGLTSQYASDNKCFISLMNKYKSIFKTYPKTPVADAGYGNLETYSFCKNNQIELFMKFASWEKETHNKKFHEDPFRSVNFKIDEDGHPICPNGKKFYKLYEKPIKGNKDKRTEEKYQCENCEGCPLRNQCHQSKNNRIISINRTLTSYHKEVIDNLASERGIELRCTRSYMAEGAFGVIKQDYNYRRISRVSLKKVNLELYLIIIGFNLAKYHNLKYRSNLEVC
mgnify:FL=1